MRTQDDTPSGGRKGKERRERPFKPVEGRVYRTADLARWTRNPTRLARRLVERGELVALAGGLYGVPRKSRFGNVPPRSEDVVRAYLKGTPFVFTGPDRWNALGLGSTAVFPLQVVYNTKRSGTADLGGRRYLFRRVQFPRKPTREWFAIDLIEHRSMVGIDIETIERGLRSSIRRGELDPGRLRRAAARYGTRRTLHLVEAVTDSEAAA